MGAGYPLIHFVILSEQGEWGADQIGYALDFDTFACFV